MQMGQPFFFHYNIIIPPKTIRPFSVNGLSPESSENKKFFIEIQEKCAIIIIVKMRKAFRYLRKD